MKPDTLQLKTHEQPQTTVSYVKSDFTPNQIPTFPVEAPVQKATSNMILIELAFHVTKPVDNVVEPVSLYSLCTTKIIIPKLVCRPMPI